VKSRENIFTLTSVPLTELTTKPKNNMQVKLVAMNRKERVSAKTGRPFTSLGIKTEEHQERWLSGFENDITKNWKIGDVVEIELTTKGDYLNFSTPKADRGPAALNGATSELKNILMLQILPRLDKILAANERMGAYLAGEMPNFNMSSEGITKEDTPF
jgi:hypothetical protein